MFKTIRLMIPELLPFLFMPFNEWSTGWADFKDDIAEHNRQEARRKAREDLICTRHGEGQLLTGKRIHYQRSHSTGVCSFLNSNFVSF